METGDRRGEIRNWRLGRRIANLTFVFPFFLLSSLFSVLCFLTGCEKGDRLVLARVDGRSITVADYRQMVEKFRDASDTTKTIDITVKRQWLDTIITKEITIHEGLRRGLDHSPRVTRELKHYEAHCLQEVVYSRDIIPQITVSDDELRKYFIENGYDKEIKTSQIICGTRAVADSLLKALKAGASFAMLAEDYSIHRPSGRNGGDMGFLREKMILPELRPILSLRVGQLYPRPLRSEFGYHIIKVTDRHTLTFKSQREKISGILVNLKKKEKTTAYMSSLEKEYHLSPDRTAVHLLVEGGKSAQQGIPPVESTAIAKPLFTWTDGSLTIDEYLQYLRSLDFPSRPAPTDTSAILRLGKDLSLEQILVIDARKRGYDRAPDIREKLISKRDDLIVDELYRLEGGDVKKIHSSLRAKYASRIVIYQDRLARVML
jgi:hypothetical protein